VTVKSFKAIEIFFSYSHEDEKLRKQLGKYVEVLKQQNIVSDWHDRKITAGTDWKGKIDEHLDSAHMILLLVSVDFLISGYIKDIELKRAMERHEAGEARVIPIILRKCTWEKESFGKLQALPANARPVTLWPNRDVAFTEVATGIGLVIEELRQKPVTSARARRKAKEVQKRPPGSKFKTSPRSPDALRRSPTQNYLRKKWKCWSRSL
jgi:TIR domain-containing protein